MSKDKIFREAEIKGNKDKSKTLIIIHDNVYDVTKFLEEVQYDVKNNYVM